MSYLQFDIIKILFHILEFYMDLKSFMVFLNSTHNFDFGCRKCIILKIVLCKVLKQIWQVKKCAQFKQENKYAGRSTDKMMAVWV